jgi:hypothetical protein
LLVNHCQDAYSTHNGSLSNPSISHSATTETTSPLRLFSHLCPDSEEWEHLAKSGTVRNMSDFDVAALLKEFAQLRASNTALESIVERSLREVQLLRSQSDHVPQQHHHEQPHHHEHSQQHQQDQLQISHASNTSTTSTHTTRPLSTSLPQLPLGYSVPATGSTAATTAIPTATDAISSSSSNSNSGGGGVACKGDAPNACAADGCSRALPTCLGYREKIRPPRHSLQFLPLQFDTSATADGVGCNTWYVVGWLVGCSIDRSIDQYMYALY